MLNNVIFSLFSALLEETESKYYRKNKLLIVIRYRNVVFNIYSTFIDN